MNTHLLTIDNTQSEFLQIQVLNRNILEFRSIEIVVPSILLQIDINQLSNL